MLRYGPRDILINNLTLRLKGPLKLPIKHLIEIMQPVVFSDDLS